MTFEVVDPIGNPLWHQLASRPAADVFHAPSWLRVLRDSYDFDIEARVIVDGAGTAEAGFVYAQIVDFMDPRIVSLPFSDFCDPLTETADQWERLVGDLFGRSQPIQVRCLHNEQPVGDERFEIADRARWHGIDLRRDLDAIWEGLDGAARRSIRKARAAGIEVRVARDQEDLRRFFDLHLRLRKYKYQLLAQPFRFFQSIWEHFLAEDHGALMLAQTGDAVIGGVMFLEWQDTMYYKFNASDPTYLSERPNDLILWEGITLAHQRGLAQLDFGLSDWDQEGLLRYKRKYATEEKTIHRLQHSPAGSPSRRERDARRLLPHLTDLLVDEEVPDRVTEAGGDLLYRFFT